MSEFNSVVELVDKDDVASTPGAADLDSLTMLEWLRKVFPDQPSMPARIDVLFRTLLGADISETSFLYLAHYFACGGGVDAALGEGKHSAQYQRLYDGEWRPCWTIFRRKIQSKLTSYRNSEHQQ